MLGRPHSIYISPYDPEKHVWVVDDGRHAIFKFTNDGSELVQTIGIPGEGGIDEEHLFWPSYMDWLPDGSFYVADGGDFYRADRALGARVVKFDADGNYLLEWGREGVPPETRPAYFNNVHGIAVDPASGRVFVNDRQNHRIQVFTEDGEFIEEWPDGWYRCGIVFTSDGVDTNGRCDIFVADDDNERGGSGKSTTLRRCVNNSSSSSKRRKICRL